MLRISRPNKQSCVILSLSFVFEAEALVMMVVVQVGIDTARDEASTDIDEDRFVRRSDVVSLIPCSRRVEHQPSAISH